MTKILVVDDEPDLEALIKQKFRQKIRNKEYDFVFAMNGNEALTKIGEHPEIEVVLSDINMPEMDGLTLLSKLNEKQLLLKSVMVSAYGDMQNIRTAMNAGAFDFVTKPIDFVDLEATVQKTILQVAAMKKTVQALKENDILKMYVDETVLNFMDSREFESELTSSEMIEASVVFIDISGFTSLSEKETPEKVVKLLNKYFDIIVSEIIKEKGVIDKFIGDAVMAVFKGEHHLDRAIDSSLAVRNAIKKLADGETFQPNVSIGINSGEMISGNIGSGALKKLDFTVIGDIVNVAARLQSAAEPGQILITADCHDQIKESFSCNEIGPKSLRNKKSEVVVYEVVE